MATYETLNENISVNVTFYDGTKPKFTAFKWRDRIYQNLRLNLDNLFDKGSESVHIFSVSNSVGVFKLRFDTVQLKWRIISAYWKD
jgi:hypothetical protein